MGCGEILNAQFEKYNYLLDAVSETLSTLQSILGETTLSHADRIEKILKKN